MVIEGAVFDGAVIDRAVAEGAVMAGAVFDGAVIEVLLCLGAVAAVMWPTRPRALPSLPSRSGRSSRFRRASALRARASRGPALSGRRVLVGALVVVIGGFLAALTSWWWATAGAIAGATGMRLVRRGREAAQLRADVGAVTAGLHALIRELRSGVHPAEAVAHTAEGSPPRIAALLSSVRFTPKSAGRVRPLLADVQQRLYAGWQLSAQYGIPLTAVLAALATDIDDRAQSIQAVAAQSAGPAISGYVLAVLPVAGIALGMGMGARPLAVLGHSAVGGLLAVTGVALCCAGLVWVDRIARAASDD